MELLLNSGLLGAIRRVAIPTALSVSASSSNTTTNNESCTSVTASISCTPSGGTPPYTYSWSKVSGEGSINTSTSDGFVRVALLNICPSTNVSGIYNCTVTDSLGDQSSQNVTFSSINTNGGGI